MNVWRRSSYVCYYEGWKTPTDRPKSIQAERLFYRVRKYHMFISKEEDLKPLSGLKPYVNHYGPLNFSIAQDPGTVQRQTLYATPCRFLPHLRFVDIIFDFESSQRSFSHTIQSFYANENGLFEALADRAGVACNLKITCDEEEEVSDEGNESIMRQRQKDTSVAISSFLLFPPTIKLYKVEISLPRHYDLAHIDYWPKDARAAEVIVQKGYPELLKYTLGTLRPASFIVLSACDTQQVIEFDLVAALAGTLRRFSISSVTGYTFQTNLTQHVYFPELVHLDARGLLADWDQQLLHNPLPKLRNFVGRMSKATLTALYDAVGRQTLPPHCIITLEHSMPETDDFARYLDTLKTPEFRSLCRQRDVQLDLHISAGHASMTTAAALLAQPDVRTLCHHLRLSINAAQQAHYPPRHAQWPHMRTLHISTVSRETNLTLDAWLVTETAQQILVDLYAPMLHSIHFKLSGPESPWALIHHLCRMIQAGILPALEQVSITIHRVSTDPRDVYTVRTDEPCLYEVAIKRALEKVCHSKGVILVWDSDDSDI